MGVMGNAEILGSIFVTAMMLEESEALLCRPFFSPDFEYNVIILRTERKRPLLIITLLNVGE